MRLLPRNDVFFELFTQSATIMVDSAGLLRDLLAAEPSRREAIASAIKRLERQADDVTHSVVTRLDRSFITPLDREDIHILASRLDDVIDRIDGIARRSQIFQLGDAPEGAVAMADVIQRAAAQLLSAIKVLADGKARVVHGACREVKRLEEEGDALYHRWLGLLFADATDALYVVKWKEIYDTLEKTLDSAEDAANVLESVAIKHG